MLLGPVGEKAEVTHSHEAFWQNVKQEAVDKFLGGESHGFEPIFVFSIPVSEGDLTVFHAEDAVVGDSYSVGVAAQVIEDLLWGSEGFFRIDDPGCFCRPRFNSIFVDDDLSGRLRDSGRTLRSTLLFALALQP